MALTITALGSPVEHDTAQGQFNKVVQIDSTHWLLLYQGSAGDGFAQIFTIDGSGNVSETGTGLEFDTGDQLGVDAVLMDGSNHVLVTWAGVGSDGFAQILTVNLGTWAVTAEGTPLEYDTDQGVAPRVGKIDSTHAIVTYQGTLADGFAIILDINTGTWAVTDNAAASLEFDTGDYTLASLNMINSDSARWLVTYRGVSADGFAKVLTVNTSTWEITETSSLEFDTTNGGYNSTVQLDANHFLNTWSGGATANGKAQVLTVNLSTWAITAELSAITFDANATLFNSVTLLGSDSIYYHTVVANGGLDGDGFVKSVLINKLNWNVTTDAFLEFDTADANHVEIVKVSASRFMIFWSGVGADGFVQAFDINIPPTVSLNSPADASSDSDTTPTLDFTGTDVNGNDIRYLTQISTVNTFDPLIDSMANSGVKASVSNYSFNITVAANSNRFLTVTVATRDGDNPTNRPVTGITADGVAMTLLKAMSSTDADGDDTRAEIWGLVAPNTGTIAISVTYTGTVDFTAAAALSAYNVKQSITPNATGEDDETAGAGTDSPAVSVTTTVANCLIVDVMYHQDSEDFLVGRYRTQIAQLGVNAGGDGFASSYKLEPLIGATTMDWFITGFKDSFVQVAVALEPVTDLEITALSGTDSGYANPDNGGDTDPFTSGENIQYTVQGGDALVADTYYWRVIGLDPTGSNYWGDKSSTRSFEITSGGTEEATASPVVLTLSAVTPATSYVYVVANTPLAIAVTLTVVTPTVSWIDVQATAPDPVALTLSVVDPARSYVYVVGNTPDPIATTLTVVTPSTSYIQVNTATPDAVVLTLSTVAPARSYVYEQTATHDPIQLALTVVDPEASSAIVATATPDPVVVTLSAITPDRSYIQIHSNTPDPVSITLSVVTPTSGYAQVNTRVADAISLTLSVVAPTTSYVQVNTAAPDAISLTLSTVTPSSTHAEVITRAVTPISLTASIITPDTSYELGLTETFPLPISLLLTIKQPEVVAFDAQGILWYLANNPGWNSANPTSWYVDDPHPFI